MKSLWIAKKSEIILLKPQLSNQLGMTKYIY